jgi:proteic killer suppression protein
VAIRSFRHAGLAAFFRTGSKAGIQPAHASRLSRILAVLDAATGAQEITLPGLRLHPLKGDQAGRWAVSVSGNWRVSFGFTGEDVTEVDYEDYH